MVRTGSDPVEDRGPGGVDAREKGSLAAGERQTRQAREAAQHRRAAKYARALALIMAATIAGTAQRR